MNTTERGTGRLLFRTFGKAAKTMTPFDGATRTVHRLPTEGARAGGLLLVPLSQKMSQKVAGAAVRESGSGAIPK